MAKRSDEKKIAFFDDLDEAREKSGEEEQPVHNGHTDSSDDSDLNTVDEVDEIDEMKAEMEQLKNESTETRDRLLRVSAEFENYKKRMNRQMAEIKKYANEALLKDLLSVVDNLERALNSTATVADGDDNKTCVIEGVEMTLNEILKILKNYDVKPIESMGEPFNPAFHEAVLQEETDAYPENTVINEFQKGYMIHDRLLRPAMVIVSKGK